MFSALNVLSSRLCRYGICLLLAFSLAACQSLGKPRMLPAEVHITNTVSGTSIFNVSVNVYSNTLDRGSRGGEGCCIGLPEQWQPDMLATVAWVTDPSPGVNPGGVKSPPPGRYGSLTVEGKKWYEIHEVNYIRHQIRIPVPRYDRVASLELVFLPCDEVYPIINSAEQSRVFGHIGYNVPVKEWKREVIRRMGRKEACLQK
ncbi:DUF3304 domain-containing protein [Pseudogulbenkiania sp. MAI-1]|uniref:DUF3304 domain-containing protein n=1 Tax=Pseudogulbenkiania sp. MAI-1 TaxID=990370 RepID=UPI000A03E65C|nr:DUF3304 domain-containing protein [Pseudogulbenkiania sp. MAI-1]